MRILLLTDLHDRRDWYRWAAGQAADLTAVAGDLLDGFHPDGLLPQMVALKKWADGFPGALALSSGNHDANLGGGAGAVDAVQLYEHPEAHALLAEEHWMDALGRPGVVTDRRSQILETPAGKIVVTTVPFFPGIRGPRLCNELWEEGRQLRAASRAPWLVLHHEPPADTAVGGHWGDMSLYWKIQDCQPDFVLSGHIHSQPYAGDFAERLGVSWCFNPGFPEGGLAAAPNHILLDLARGTATWHRNPEGKSGRPISKRINLR